MEIGELAYHGHPTNTTFGSRLDCVSTLARRSSEVVPCPAYRVASQTRAAPGNTFQSVADSPARLLSDASLVSGFYAQPRTHICHTYDHAPVLPRSRSIFVPRPITMFSFRHAPVAKARNCMPCRNLKTPKLWHWWVKCDSAEPGPTEHFDSTHI
ncbi:predicted protein [Verticillium alfalfae VaMs.102]|uniref:Predicted protein n=1 Tax=Verticillium alfalfae (strain VaMs.102 / ATCC MYA-4576 / FGSC 10136) TaxID=526221 RepID=C9SQL5_VERA1|nr:predicted protein [Verticillium alfalfae VaMs.102]EEY21140.1 predicted protein [Verticillium alfalfae VaMs.102]